MIKRIIYSSLPIIGGAIVGLITSGYMDYSDMVKPPLSPPGIVFPIVWTILYILMGISYFLATKDNEDNKELDQIYLLQLLVNFMWPIIFFVLEMYFTAFLWIILLLILVIVMIKELLNVNKVSGYLQIPYLIWLLFATYLNLGITLLN
ncbi:MAG TPA: tryptophan-rich sensory protein [Candidatus Onthousia excrementipullorum]|uniref:Tryptophan-rich sensory protein n=1 Tax=Candidatus Onthousia excrementipullorum TaxID=2840884 RepID=A0A9D1J2P2_9FIRM|nr:tryptophan-rich sensory protein [Candidatus Onthousia excrementipullorum]